MITFTLDSNEVALRPELPGLRLTTNFGGNLLIANASLTETQQVVTQNYDIVKQHYLNLSNNRVLTKDIEMVSLHVVLNYFYLYQLWRTLYTHQENRSLAFLQADFGHPNTADTITAYFKAKYPEDYHTKCSILLGMDKEAFKLYEKGRQQFYDR